MAINLEKSAEKLKISLEKKGLAILPPLDVVYIEDVSGSYRPQHNDGSTGILLSRMVPWAMVFDQDKKMDLFTFSNGNDNAVYVGEVTPDNHEGYLKKYVIDKVDGWGGCTDYSYVIRKTLVHLGWIADAKAHKTKKDSGLFGGLFGKKTKDEPTPGVTPTAKRKGIVLFNTDGANSDETATECLLQEMQDKGYCVYLMFLAFKNQGANFKFIARMADKFDNCGLCVIIDLKKFIEKTDEELNEELVTQELVDWLKK
jgi:hypothetical protein